MNAHNIAMMVDPMTPLMYVVQMMNFLKTLITKTLENRQDSRIDPTPTSYAKPSDESGHENPSQLYLKSYHDEDSEESESEYYHFEDDSFSYSPRKPQEDGSESDDSPFHWQSFKGLQASLNFVQDPCFKISIKPLDWFNPVIPMMERTLFP